MENKHRRIAIFIVLMLLSFSFFGKPYTVMAQEDGPDYYFPIFMKEGDPFYAYGLDGGTVEGMVIDPTNSNILYANSWGSGVYKSTDGGRNWVRKSVGLESGFVYELAIDPSNTQHILASDYEHELKQTFNGGESWEAVSGITSGSVVYSIDFNPQNPSIVYVGLREPTIYENGQPVAWPGGVFKSTNGGSSWSRASSGLPLDYIYDLAVDPNNPNVIYTAMHRTGVYKTTNAGASWNAKNDTMIDGDVRSVYVTPDSSRVYIGFWDGYGLSYSTNGGDSWVSVNWTNERNLNVWEAQVDPHHPSSVYLSTSTGIYLCENPASTTSCQVFAHEGRFTFDLTLDEHGPVNPDGHTRVMYTGLQHHAIFKSTNGGVSFGPSYRNIRANIINAILIDPNNSSIQYVSSQGRGLFKTVDNGASWAPLNEALPIEYINTLAFRPSQSNVIYAGTTYNGVLVSNDYGRNWLSTSSGLSREGVGGEIPPEEMPPAEIYSWMDPVDRENMLAAQPPIGGDRSAASSDVLTIGFHVDPNQSQYMFIGTNAAGVKLSSNSGTSWSSSGLSNGIVTDSLVNPSGSPYTYFISLDGTGVKTSQDRNTWSDMSSGLPTRVFALANIPGSTMYFAGTDRGIYRLPNTGSFWSLVGISGIKVNDISVDPNNTTQLWAATKRGLYHSSDSGASWSYYSLPDIHNTELLTIVPVPGTGGFVIGTNGGDYYHFTP